MLKVITNRVPRDIVEAWNLTPVERLEFDYLDWAKLETGEDSASFIRYRGSVIPLNDFSADWGITRGTGLPDDLAGWDGYLSDTFFSGLVVKYADESCESVIVGRFYVASDVS